MGRDNSEKDGKNDRIKIDNYLSLFHIMGQDSQRWHEDLHAWIISNKENRQGLFIYDMANMCENWEKSNNEKKAYMSKKECREETNKSRYYKSKASTTLRNVNIERIQVEETLITMDVP